MSKIIAPEERLRHEEAIAGELLLPIPGALTLGYASGLLLRPAAHLGISSRRMVFVDEAIEIIRQDELLSIFLVIHTEGEHRRHISSEFATETRESIKPISYRCCLK